MRACMLWRSRALATLVRNPDANASTLLSTGCAHGTRSLARSAPGAPQEVLGGGTEGETLCRRNLTRTSARFQGVIHRLRRNDPECRRFVTACR